MKKIFIVIISIIIIFIIAFVVFINIKKNTLAGEINKEYVKVTAIDLKKIPDGTYKGSYINLPVGIDIEVNIRDHKIADIKVIKQYNGPNHEARQTINDIINKQETMVDTISGSTLSSKTIMIAVNRSLTSK